MKALTIEQLTSFSSQWLWICTDRVREFEHLLSVPVSDAAFMKKCTVPYLDHVYSPKPDTDGSRIPAFRNLLSTLEAHGEDVDHLYDWAFSVTEYMQPVEAQVAMSFWERALAELSRRRRDPVSTLPEHRMAELVRSFIDDVREPATAASEEQDASESLWLASPERRGEYDDVVWKYHFSKINVDPALYIVDGYREALVRHWWRTTRTTLSADELQGLYRELEALALFPNPSVAEMAGLDAALIDGFLEIDPGRA
jgi:hypothetical protein